MLPFAIIPFLFLTGFSSRRFEGRRLEFALIYAAIVTVLAALAGQAVNGEDTAINRVWWFMVWDVGPVAGYYLVARIVRTGAQLT